MKYLTKRKRAFSLSVVFAVLLLFVFSVSLQGAINVDPMNMRFEAEAGKTVTKTISITNKGSKSTEVNLTLLDWWRDSQGSLQIFQAGSRERSCAEWLLYSPSSLTIPPNETRDVTVEIEVPEEKESAGTHWAMLIVQERGEVSEEEQVSTRITVNYIVKIFYDDPSYTKKAAKITKIEMEEKRPLKLTVVLENSSKSYLRAEGSVSIRNLQGETEKEIKVESVGLLPGGKREISVTTGEEPVLDPGEYYAIAIMDYGGDHLIQGGLPLEIPEKAKESPN